jgi:hypothetical protein
MDSLTKSQVGRIERLKDLGLTESQIRQIIRLEDLGVEIPEHPAIITIEHTTTVVGKYGDEGEKINFVLDGVSEKDSGKFDVLRIGISDKKGENGKLWPVYPSDAVERIKAKRRKAKKAKNIRLTESWGGLEKFLTDKGKEESPKAIFKLKLGNVNKYDFTTKTITLNKEYSCDETLDHELGHAVMHELTFGKLFNPPEVPNFMEAAEYAWATYVSDVGVENASEGWAQSFCDYFNRPEYLKKESLILYNFWHDVIDLNPQITDMRTSLHRSLHRILRDKGKEEVIGMEKYRYEGMEKHLNDETRKPTEPYSREEKLYKKLIEEGKIKPAVKVTFTKPIDRTK